MISFLRTSQSQIRSSLRAQCSKLKRSLFSVNATVTAVVASATAAGPATAPVSLPALPPGEEIYDLMPPVALSYPWWQLAVEAAAVAFSFWLLWLFYSWLTAPVERHRKVLVQTPQKQALRAIERLKLSPVWHERQLKEICESLAGILKTYAHEAFNIGLGAPSTSDELLCSLSHYSVDRNVHAKIRELLETCDRIKFAGVTDCAAQPEDLLEMLAELVRREGWLK